MNFQEASPQDAAQQTWDQLDAEDAGTAQPPIPGETQQAQTVDVPAAQAPAQETGAKDNESVASASEQTLLDKLAGLESQFGTLAQRLRNAEGHIGGLDSQLKRTLQTANSVAAQGGDAPSAAQIKRAEGDPEAMKSLKRDYPEFATAMQEAMTESMAEFERRLAAQAPAQSQQQAPVTADDVAQIRRELTVEMRHPGWQQTVQTPEFAGWLQRQPREVVMLSTSPDPQDAVRLLDIHAESNKTPVSQEQTQRTQRLNSAAAIPQGRSASRTTQKDWKDMSPQEQWRYLDEVEKSKG